MHTYIINVARDMGKRQFDDPNEILYQHYFRIELDTRYTASKVLDITTDILERFPREDGFDVTMTKWTIPVGHDVEIQKGN
jgi:hypothetical protein